MVLEVLCDVMWCCVVRCCMVLRSVVWLLQNIDFGKVRYVGNLRSHRCHHYRKLKTYHVVVLLSGVI